MKPEAQLFLMGVLGVAGSVLSAHAECEEIHRRNNTPDHAELPHWLLTMIRFGAALMIAVWMIGWKWRVLTLILFSACCFGTSHRITLNILRVSRYPNENRSIKWHHLRTRGYDVILSPLFPQEKPRFIAICLLEILLGAAIFTQASVQ